MKASEWRNLGRALQALEGLRQFALVLMITSAACLALHFFLGGH